MTSLSTSFSDSTEASDGTEPKTRSHAEITQAAQLKPIAGIAEVLGLSKARLPKTMKRRGQVVLVTAISPTPGASGRTTPAAEP